MTKSTLKHIIIGILLLAVTQSLTAESSMQKANIHQLDRSMTKHKARKRTFRNKEEYQKDKKHLRNKAMQHSKRGNYTEYGKDDYKERYRYSRHANPFSMHQHRIHAKAYRDFKRGWVLAYKYDRAGFYDRNGFYYGYFNRYGFFFDGNFYRYDRYYTYRDRVRGRGIFDYYFYRPADWKYYGFY